ncbi:hypothetical protein GCM10027176_51320 [Actinoallomurus bryophytorum]
MRGFVPRPLEPTEEIRYCAQFVVRLPRPSPFRQPDCMTIGTPWWRRLCRQIVPRHGGSACCWYHQGDWHTVSKTAIRLMRQAERAGVATDDLDTHIIAEANAMGSARGS